MDYNDRDLGQPFTIPDLWAPSQVHSRESQTGGILFSQHHFDDLNIPTSEPLLPKTPAQQNDLLHVATEEPTGYGDIWLLPEETPLEEANFKSWDVFVNESVQERQTPYITELDRATFDAALVDKTDLLRVNNSQHVVVDSRTYTVSLLALGLGRSSVIFAWNEEKQTFISAFPEMRISGFTGESMDALLTMFMDCGNITKSLQRFIHQAYTEGVSPSRVALADTVTDSMKEILLEVLARVSRPWLNFCVPGSRQIGDQPSLSAPVSLLPLLSFNHIISAQARIVNGTCMRMFFKNHNLREHLDLQHSFHLLGNGVFSTLMGLLAESHISRSNQSSSGGSTFLAQSLPGDLSFAVRDMSEDQIEKCMNPNSVEALDFLRLSYKPPQPLDAVITPVILYKYDQIFKLLLRLIRMLYVVSALFQHATTRCSRLRGLDGMAQRFRIEAQQFVSSVCGYFFDTGIAATWQVFQRKLDQVEERFNTDNHNFSLGQDEGIDKLRDYHEKVVDRIMFVLLLRKRQQPVMKLLEEIFTLILQFSERSRQLGLEVGGAPDKQVGELYAKFQRKVGVFITVCKSLSEKAGYGEKTLAGKHTPTTLGLFNLDDLAEENTICQLLLRLEMNHYYGKTVNV
ncbi:putative Gamma-tubulin complex component 6 [Glarea lozoyensis 74030]|uniref:Spindle pole body component n=1 Tax=Glarea lozoyensis (strain ATCC 74030 / MF5533) TaxID=1104152 RepID=H0EFJ5_GLAL7|nr:putative Gamma-tubulin complex component 6 [Glarea lozoyensis 74030]